MLFRLALVCFLFSLAAGQVFAQPVVSDVSGTAGHGNELTITGNAFGSKVPAAPMWWDDGEGQTLDSSSAINDRYNSAEPRQVTEEGGVSNMQYRAAGHRSVDGPHAHSETFMTGCHDDQGECAGGEVGQNVMLTVSDQTRHEDWFVSYYLRLDPAWPNTGTENYKYFNWETSPPYRFYSNPFCYENVNGCSGSGYQGTRYAPGCRENYWGSPGVIQVFDTDTCGDWAWDETPSLYGGPVISGSQNVANPALDWVKNEHILSLADSPLLFYQHKINNVGLIDTTQDPEGDCRHSARADSPFGGASIGGFWKGGECGGGQDDLDDDACRYFDDVYVDSTLSRVVLTDNQAYEEARIVEPQIPSAWSGSSISVTANLGKLSGGETAYLFVFDADNNRNATGFEVALDGTNGSADGGGDDNGDANDGGCGCRTAGSAGSVASLLLAALVLLALRRRRCL